MKQRGRGMEKLRGWPVTNCPGEVLSVTWSRHEHPIALDTSIGGPPVTCYAGPRGRAPVLCVGVGTVKGQMSQTLSTPNACRNRALTKTVNVSATDLSVRSRTAPGGWGGGVWHGTLCFFFGCRSRCPKPPAFLDSEAWVSEMRDEPDGSSLTTPSAQADLFAALLTGLRTEFCFAWVLGRK